ncbi:MAG: hypothetical protein H7X71_08380, partial [Chitinophagales bacterium]|nr:hypothetical protein [Chitinophagales bacterium]
MKKIYLYILTLSLSCFLFVNPVMSSGDHLQENYTAGEVCIAVTEFYSTNPTDSTIDISWSPALEALSYVINYRGFGDTAWLGFGTTDTLVTLYALEACTSYEYAITVICLDGELMSLLDTFTTTCDTTTTFLSSVGKENRVVIFPNPSDGFINIDFRQPVYGEITMHLYSTVGMLIDKQYIYLH